MLTLPQIISELQAHRKLIQHELGRLDSAISALRGSNTGSHSRPSGISSPDRSRILAQKTHSANGNTAITKPKRSMSAATRRKIAAAQKARWAARKAKKNKAV